MELKDVINLRNFEEYLKERNYKLNSYEDAILQSFWPLFQDFQLLFLLKDSSIPCDFEWLRSSYYDKIHGFYSTFYPPMVLKANVEGDFWARVPYLSWSGVEITPFHGFYQWVPEFHDTWKKFDEAFLSYQDYLPIYEDEVVRIVAFLLKLKKPFDSERPTVRVFYRSGFCLNPNMPCDVIKKEVFQEYAYHYLNAADTINLLGLNEYFQMGTYYKKQSIELKKRLNH